AARDLADLICDGPDRVRRISAKTGEGVEDVLDAIIERVPPPAGDPDAPPRALIFDSSSDQYRGVVAFVRVVDGRFSTREPLRAMALGTRFEAEELGFFSPTRSESGLLEAGEVGYVITGLKDVSRLRVGDTITSERRSASQPLPGYKDVKVDLDLIVTAPNVSYRVKPPNGAWVEVHSPADMPNEIEDVEEPYIKASIIVPKEYVGAVMELNNDRRGRFDHLEYLSEERV